MPNELMQFDNSYLKDAVLQKLKEGETPFSVATWVQQDLLEMTEMPTSELARSIKGFYISTVPVQERMNLTKNRGAIKRTVERQRTQTSALEEMSALYFLQKGRIELAHQQELIDAERREKAQKDENFDDEIEDMFDDLGGDTVDKPAQKEKKPRKARKGESDTVISGTLDNTIETARRLLTDIHKMQTELGYNPRQYGKDDEETTKHTPEFEVKRALVLEKAINRMATIDLDDIEVAEIEEVHE